jgi:hypothetical protein
MTAPKFDAARIADLEAQRDCSTRALHRASEAMTKLVLERDGARRERDTALERIDELTAAHAEALQLARDASARARDLDAELEGTRRELERARSRMPRDVSDVPLSQFFAQVASLHAARAANSGLTAASWTADQVIAWCEAQTIEVGDAMDTQTWCEACEYDEASEHNARGL